MIELGWRIYGRMLGAVRGTQVDAVTPWFLYVFDAAALRSREKGAGVHGHPLDPLASMGETPTVPLQVAQSIAWSYSTGRRRLLLR